MRSFVFDADGVVCVGGSFTSAFEKEHGVPHDCLKAFFQGPFRECLLGSRDLIQEVKPYLKEWGWKGTAGDLVRFWFEREHVLCPEILGCVRWLRRKGHRCVLGTNQERHRTAYLRQEMGLQAEFDEIFASCELAVTKPSPEFFQGIEERLNKTPMELCLIDDAERNVDAARAAGWTSIWHHGDPKAVVGEIWEMVEKDL